MYLDGFLSLLQRGFYGANKMTQLARPGHRKHDRKRINRASEVEKENGRKRGARYGDGYVVVCFWSSEEIAAGLQRVVAVLRSSSGFMFPINVGRQQ
jgi:hypothetical protein